MAITGVNGYYSMTANAVTKPEADSATEKTREDFEKRVKRRKESKESKQYSNVSEYTKYLQQKYSYMNTGTASMWGIPTTVSVSAAFLKKCTDNPEKAKYLEENLAAISDCVKSLADYTKTMPGNPVCTYAAYIIGDDGNITFMGGCTNDPDGRIARENAERKAKEEKEAKEKLEKKREERRADEQRAIQERLERKALEEFQNSYQMTMQGTDIKSITQNIVSRLQFSDITGKEGISGFDIKA